MNNAFFIAFWGMLPLVFSFYAVAEQPRSYDSFRKFSITSGQFPSAVSRLETLAIELQTNPDMELQESVEQKVENLKNAITRGYFDEVYILAGHIYELKGDNQNALKSYKKALKLRSSDPAPLFRTAMIYKSQKDFKRALEYLNEVRWRTNMLLYETYFEMAVCFLALNEEEKALDLLSQAHAQNPFFSEAVKLLLKIQQEKIDTETDPSKRFLLEGKTLGLLRSIILQNPDEIEASKNYAALVIRRSDPLMDSEGLQEVERIMAGIVQKTAYKDEHALRLYIDALLKQNKLQAAEKVLQKGLETNGLSPVLNQIQAQLALEKGLDSEE